MSSWQFKRPGPNGTNGQKPRSKRNGTGEPIHFERSLAANESLVATQMSSTPIKTVTSADPTPLAVIAALQQKGMCGYRINTLLKMRNGEDVRHRDNVLVDTLGRVIAISTDDWQRHDLVVNKHEITVLLRLAMPIPQRRDVVMWVHALAAECDAFALLAKMQHYELSDITLLLFRHRDLSTTDKAQLQRLQNALIEQIKETKQA